MALFPWQQPQKPRRQHTHSQLYHQQPNRYSQPQRYQPQPASLPPFMHRLNLICHDRSHPLPVAMKHIGDGTSHRGQPMAIYACPMCNLRQGWVVDVHTGQPRQLWCGKPNN